MLKVAGIIDVDQMGWITAPDLRQEDGQGQGWVSLQPSRHPRILSGLRGLGGPELTVPPCGVAGNESPCLLLPSPAAVHLIPIHSPGFHGIFP